MSMIAIDPREVADRIRRRRASVAGNIRAGAARALEEPSWPVGARLFLFGSRARGDAVTGSDVDLIVLGARDPQERAMVEQALHRHLSAWPLDILFFDSAERLGSQGRRILASAIELKPKSG